MSPRTTINRKLKAALAAAGFTIAAPTTDPLEGMAWTVRKNMHRYTAGQALMDHRDAMQFGVNEDSARFWPTTKFIVGVKIMPPLPAKVDNTVWILGPGAAYIATGTAQQLLQLKDQLILAFPDEVPL